MRLWFSEPGGLLLRPESLYKNLYTGGLKN
jgi:hypothetical protein